MAVRLLRPVFVTLPGMDSVYQNIRDHGNSTAMKQREDNSQH